jgi:hypothetical protein
MSRPPLSRGNWTLREDGSQRFEASRDGTQTGIHGAVIQAPARSSSSLPSSSRPRTANTDDERLPLPRLSSGRVRELRPLTSQFSDSSDDQPAPRYPPQINPFAPYGDHRPHQPDVGSSPPRPTSMDQVMSDGPIDPRRPVSQGSTASDGSWRPTSPTPLSRRDLDNRINELWPSLNPSELQVATNPHATVAQLSRVLSGVTTRLDSERRAALYRAQQRASQGRGGRR